MIAKRVPKTASKKGGFADLEKYLTDEKDKQENERVGHVEVTNCQSDQSATAALEVLNTQAQNKRATGDKTYHLIVSFPAGEQPDASILKQIETRLCAGLGFEEHQRISVVHHDTDNLHLHVAINAIHPTRYTMHNPHNDFKTLGELCAKLEKEYGLQTDNHVANKRGAENRADDMECHSGVESLIGWVQREVADKMQAAQSWAALHQVMQEHGLRLHQRGNGLVLTAEDGTTVKASSVGREYSKKKLEDRYGAFEQSAQQPQPAPKKYEAKASASRVDTVELYARYKKEQQDRGTGRAIAWAEARERKQRAMDAAKQAGRLKRAAIKVIPGGGSGKKILYAAVSATMKSDIDKINRRYRKERQEISDRFQRGAWADWLQTKALDGDQEALTALRGRLRAGGIAGDLVTGEGAPRPVMPPAAAANVTKAGTIIYRVGATAVRDDGKKLNVSRGADTAGIQAALRLAVERYGSEITVGGSAAFKEKIAQAAVASGLPIRFTDPALDARRQQLSRERNHDSRPEPERPSTDRGRHPGGSPSGDRRPATGGPGAPGHAGAERPGRPGPAHSSGITPKPGVAGVGRKPPPERQNSLHDLSELGMVHIAGGSEMLLPRDVPNHLEQQEAPGHNGMRRGVSGPGAGVVTSPADKYIKERETKRLKGIAIPRHSIYPFNNAGTASFAGLREIDGQGLALLKRNDEILVLPIDDSTTRRLKQLSIGDEVTVSRDGAVKKRGRSR